MRVSNYDLFTTPSFQLGQVEQTMIQKQAEVSTGKAFQNISDDPVAANQTLIIEQSQNKIAQFQKNINNAQGFLSISESTMGSAVNLLQDALQKGQLGASDTSNASDRNTYADRVESDIEQLVGLANTKYLGKYIFAGQKTETQPFAYSNNGASATYNGDGNTIQFPVSETMNIQVSDPGNTVFSSTISALISLRDQLRANNSTGISNANGQVNTQLSNLADARSQVGTRMDTLNNMNSIYTQASTDLQTRLANVQGVDFSQAITDFTNAQRNYQAIIQSNMKATQVSILNYM